jgi:hypothetical protein
MGNFTTILVKQESLLLFLGYVERVGGFGRGLACQILSFSENFEVAGEIRI